MFNLILVFLFHREKRVGERDGFNVIQVWIICDFRVDEECDRHFHCLARLECLFSETKALDFAEIGANLEWRHIKCRRSVRGLSDRLVAR